MSEESIPIPTDKFLVVGIITSDSFQKCRFVVQKLFNSFPNMYSEPKIRPMLNVEWDDYLIKIKRKHGNGVWALKKSAVVFLNDEYLGDDDALTKHISKKFRFSLNKDWYEIGKCHLTDFLGTIMRKYRQLAYITVSINNRVVGTMLFELYNDLVPLACENFLSKCKLTVGGYVGTPIHRIMKNSWIQCGGWNLEEKKMRCENYVVPHNRRGVLCTCNNARHTDNTTQFFITLAPTPWMDYKYVAFGQLIQGAEVLKKIEEVPTFYQSPKLPIDICKTGELIFNPPPDYMTEEELDKFQRIGPSTLLDALIGPPQVDSTFSFTRWQKGLYSLATDMKSYFPAWRWPSYLMPEDYTPADDTLYYDKMARPFFDLDLIDNWKMLLTPGSSDITI